jgi:hypothetical protein
LEKYPLTDSADSSIGSLQNAGALLRLPERSPRFHLYDRDGVRLPVFS